ncbi:Asp-tRNA(Asn)/Glu-tRNA(Gln) amidotransferase subunit GatA [Zongyangia hominis]|uniref:Glutamyl-tRNA(Gln) amidotransferase subunit A n=1 Tax=Zongyangia hominis TaxID=2763677 RepID=A0A926ICB7_9FIRM|nr:Asp-tRNA(Asn)/Glu-tRNA(Gln) amidotransferase subunit GatA [Zongyangia hominis]MBC8571188.1 Asp-tRNA(Asn)/Glu-tRNA(Gln) amidotransferase subunit GatA [Zongyangia hominis]
MNITEMPVWELSRALQGKELSAVEAASAYLDEISAKEKDIGAYLTVTEEGALSTAAQVDKKRTQGEKLPPLAGVPMGIKDNICVRGVRTTCASRMLENFVPPYDAHVVERLAEHDYVLLGKTNLDEFAMGSSTENSFFQPTHNPRDLSRVPGGSSGGSAAAVAAGEAAYALGSDTGGSIRQPAAFCGVVGMKPTYGAVSRYGLVAFASSFDQIGPLTRDVRDNALVLSAIAGYDRRDSTSVDRAGGDFLSGIEAGVQGKKIALPREYFGEGIDPQVALAIEGAARRFAGLGAQVEEVSMESLPHALPAYYILSSAEASSNLARFDGVKYGFRAKGCRGVEELYLRSRSEGFGREVKRRIMLGSFVLSAGYYDAYYKKAQQVRTLIVEDFKRVFRGYDFILGPVAPTTAYRMGEKTRDPLSMYLGDVYTVPVNIAGLPALSLPCGANEDGLPIGMQLIGPAFSEGMLYQAGYAFETSAKGDA